MSAITMRVILIACSYFVLSSCSQITAQGESKRIEHPIKKDGVYTDKLPINITPQTSLLDVLTSNELLSDEGKKAMNSPDLGYRMSDEVLFSYGDGGLRSFAMVKNDDFPQSMTLLFAPWPTYGKCLELKVKRINGGWKAINRKIRPEVRMLEIENMVSQKPLKTL